jgi:hypothetical protein
MGWKLSGIVINKNFENDIAELFNLLQLEDFELEKESSFEEETSHFKDDNKLSIGFFGSGTYLSTDIHLFTNDKILKEASSDLTILAFYIYDTTSTYCFEWFSKGEYLRKKWISYSDKNIDSSENFGDLLPIEKQEEDDVDIIIGLISSLLEKDFYDIDEAEQMFCFIKRQEPESAQTKTKPFWKKLFGN